MECPRCKSNKIMFTLTPQSIHYGCNDCSDCGRWIEWVKNPESSRTKSPLRKMKITTEKVWNFHKMDDKICFFCLRTTEQLGWNETMTVDHIEELDKGGKDIIENQQVLCLACHKLKNWSRLYMNWHFKEMEVKDGRGK